MIEFMWKPFSSDLSHSRSASSRSPPSAVSLEDPVRSLFLIIAGELRLVRVLPHGFQLTLQRAGSASILAEASLFAERYHCDALAAEESAVRTVPMTKARAALESDPGLAFAAATPGRRGSSDADAR